MPDRVVGAKGDKSAEQQVAIQLLDQQPLGANAVDHLQQQDQQLLLRGNRGPAGLWVEPTNGGVEPIKSWSASLRTCRRGWEEGMRSLEET